MNSETLALVFDPGNGIQLCIIFIAMMIDRGHQINAILSVKVGFETQG